MGKFFSDAVEKALQYIYYDTKGGRARRGQEGMKLLIDATNAGDADAACMLARCLCGDQYVWSGHHFPEDDKNAEALMRQSALQGSAIGVLVAKRSGVLSLGLMKKMPLSLQEAFAIVQEKAAGGEPFCQYVIGNTYFWWDFLTILDKKKSDFPNEAEFKAYMRENISKCEDWLWRAYRGGMYLAGQNLYSYYEKGDEGYIDPQPDKAKTVYKTGAELGYPNHQFVYGGELEEEGKIEEAFRWYHRGAEGGHPNTWSWLGDRYDKGDGVPKDEVEACRCYEKAYECGEYQRCDMLGWAYFYGHGVAQDRSKAFQYFAKSLEVNESKYAQSHLARCYLEGWGTGPNYEKAYSLAWDSQTDNKQSLYVLGKLYCEGLGLPEDIARGVDFFRQANLSDAQEELKKYKKTLFGKWVRRRV